MGKFTYPASGLAFIHDQMSLSGLAMLNLTCVFPGTSTSSLRRMEHLRATTSGMGRSVVIRMGELEVEAASNSKTASLQEEIGRNRDVRAAVVLKAFLRERPTR